MEIKNIKALLNSGGIVEVKKVYLAITQDLKDSLKYSIDNSLTNEEVSINRMYIETITRLESARYSPVVDNK